MGTLITFLTTPFILCSLILAVVLVSYTGYHDWKDN